MPVMCLILQRISCGFFFRHVPEITNICLSAKRELELEIELKSIEDQWTEQV